MQHFSTGIKLGCVLIRYITQRGEITSGIDLPAVTMCSQLIKLSVAACVLLVILHASEALDCNQGKTISMRYSHHQSRSKNLPFLHLPFVYVVVSGSLGQAFCVFWKSLPQDRQGGYSHISEYMCSRKKKHFI